MCKHKRSFHLENSLGKEEFNASLAQLVEHALRKRMVVGSIPTGGLSRVLIQIVKINVV